MCMYWLHILFWTSGLTFDIFLLCPKYIIANALSCKLLMINPTNSINSILKSKTQSPFWGLKQTIKSKYKLHISSLQWQTANIPIQNGSLSKKDQAKARPNPTRKITVSLISVVLYGSLLYNILWFFAIM